MHDNLPNGRQYFQTRENQNKSENMDNDDSNVENYDILSDPGFKAGIIIAVAVVLIFIAMCIVNGCPCCSWGSKSKNYHLNMERLENGSESEKEPSAPTADSDRFYRKNIKEFNDNDLYPKANGTL